MLTLSVPTIDHSMRPHKVETRPKATTAWLSRLPFASPIDAAQQLAMALYTLNRIPLDEDERGALLALYRPVVARAASSLEVLLSESGIPPHPQQRQAGSLLGELHAEHSIGYKHLLRSLTSRRFGRSQTRYIAEITAHSLAALRDVQLACYLTYSPVPAGLWREMHNLYLLTKSNGMAGKTVNDALPADQVYCQALLLALADPPHMSRAELAHIQLYLEAFGKLAVLGDPPPGNNPHGFMIETGSDRGPGPQSTGPDVGGLWLDTEALCRHLHETAVRLRTGDTPRRIGLPTGMDSETSLTLAKRLLKLWRPGAHRAFKRYPAPGTAIQIVAGVSAIHRLLERAPHAARLPAASTDPRSGPDGGAIDAAAPAVNASHWTVCNDSAAGLALSGTPDTPLNLKVGDALALRAEDAVGWSLAIIRWVRMLDARQVDLGVERLSPRIQPVWVRPLRSHRKAGPKPGLFVPGVSALKQPDRLLLPSHIYQTGMDAEVWHAPQQYTVKFGRRAEFTPSFDLINFTVLTKAPAQ
ncbi:MAG: hypothetical protein B7X94_00575 [Hydrogenophilales bacterium 17-62-8]|nr:MAG: hypothetical protein B7X94_00575 [Hydrogenophilales bacterium 17-62-8]